MSILCTSSKLCELRVAFPELQIKMWRLRELKELAQLPMLARERTRVSTHISLTREQKPTKNILFSLLHRGEE